MLILMISMISILNKYKIGKKYKYFAGYINHSNDDISANPS